MKKSVVIYSTCQGRAIAKFLGESVEFNEKYSIDTIVSTPEFVRGTKDAKEFEEIRPLIGNADVCIYQPVKDVYAEYSTTRLKTMLKEGCIQISMPFVYNLSTFPVASIYKRDFMEVYTAEGDELALVNKDAIDRLADTGFRSAEILTMFDNNKINFSFESRHRLELDILVNRESDLDVKVADFIRDNISKKRLFLFCSHPTSTIFVHMTNQILERLGCPSLKTEYPLDYYGLTYCGFPVGYPTASQQYFKFEFNKPDEEKTANIYYRSVIERHLKARGL